MIRIAGINIPETDNVIIGLTKIYGIGRSRSKKICKYFDIPETIKIKDLSNITIESIRSKIISDFVVEGDLKRLIGLNIKRLIDLGTYRGRRHIKRLPVRGQRTRTNAKTCKRHKKKY